MTSPWWLPIPVLLLAVVTQTSFLPALGFDLIRPDFVLIAVVVWAVLRGARDALAWGFTGGLLLDLLSGAPLGTASLALVLVAYLASYGETSVFRSGFLLPTIIVFWATVLYSVLYLFLLRTHQHPVDWLTALRYTVVPGAILNTVLAPVAYWWLSRLERRTRTVVPVEW